MRKQSAFLNDVTDATSKLQLNSGIDGRVFKKNGTRIRLDQTDDQPQQCRFAATAWADEDRRFSRAISRSVGATAAVSPYVLLMPTS